MRGTIHIGIPQDAVDGMGNEIFDLMGSGSVELTDEMEGNSDKKWNNVETPVSSQKKTDESLSEYYQRIHEQVRRSVFDVFERTMRNAGKGAALSTNGLGYWRLMAHNGVSLDTATIAEAINFRESNDHEDAHIRLMTPPNATHGIISVKSRTYVGLTRLVGKAFDNLVKEYE